MDLFEVDIIADSFIDGDDPETRLTTFQLRYPRYIHSEILTHRLFSRNAQSSRAVPTKRLINECRDNPVIPSHIGANQTGMQAEEEVSPEQQKIIRQRIKDAAFEASNMAQGLLTAGAHKQVVNRYLEPYTRIAVIITSSYWDNFFTQRCHPDAEPHIRRLAEIMRRHMDDSEPEWVDPESTSITGYHMPYIYDQEVEHAKAYMESHPKMSLEGILMRVSVARCARVSYANHTGDFDIEKDINLYDRLLSSRHMSPFEHVAWPKTSKQAPMFDWCGNFSPDWVQYRKQVEHSLKLDCY